MVNYECGKTLGIQRQQAEIGSALRACENLTSSPLQDWNGYRCQPSNGGRRLRGGDLPTASRRRHPQKVVNLRGKGLHFPSTPSLGLRSQIGGVTRRPVVGILNKNIPFHGGKRNIHIPDQALTYQLPVPDCRSGRAAKPVFGALAHPLIAGSLSGGATRICVPSPPSDESEATDGQRRNCNQTRQITHDHHLYLFHSANRNNA